MQVFKFLALIIPIFFLSIFQEAFSQRSYCYDIALFSLSEDDTLKSRIWYNYDYGDFTILDSMYYSQNLVGIYGEASHDFKLYSVSQDSLFYKRYSYEFWPFSLRGLIDSSNHHIADIYGIIRTYPKTWILCKDEDSTRLISFIEGSGSTQFPDTIPLHIKDIEFFDANNVYDVPHLAGRDKNGILHYYVIGGNQGILRHSTFSSIQGTVIFAGGSNNNTILLYKHNNAIYMYNERFPIPPNSPISNDSIVFATHWGYSKVVLVSVSNGVSTFSILDYYQSISITTVAQLPVAVTKLYSSPNWGLQFGYLEYTDSLENKIIYKIDSGFKIDSNSVIQVKKNSAFGISMFCQSSTNENEFYKHSIKIVPNPVHNEAMITVDKASCEGNSYVEICSVDGKILLTKTFSASCEADFSTNELTSGLYIARLKINGQFYLKRFVKH